MIHPCINNIHILYISEHGCRKMKITRSEERVFILTQTHFSVNGNMQ
jgi:hypothetical protein